MRTLGPYAALAWRFTVQCPAGVLADEVTRTLSSLRSTSPGPAAQYRLNLSAQQGGGLELDGRSLCSSLSEWELYAQLLWHINLRAVENTQDHVLLHASAAARGDDAVVLCAPMEAGKTTLVAGLVLAGLDYLTDETVALRPEDGRITPFPKALSVDEGSWPVLPGLRPPADPSAAPLREVQWQVSPDRVRPGCVASGGRLAVVVLPQYRAGGDDRLEEVSPGTALLGVLQQTFLLERQRERDMTVLAELLGGARCYRLSVSRLDAAVDLVLPLLDGN